MVRTTARSEIPMHDILAKTFLKAVWVTAIFCGLGSPTHASDDGEREEALRTRLTERWSLLCQNETLSKKRRSMLFVAYLEGTLGIDAPEWWARALRSAHGPELAKFIGEKTIRRAQRGWRRSGDIEWTGFDSVDVEGTALLALLVEQEDLTSSIPFLGETIMEPHPDWDSYFSEAGIIGTLTESKCVLVPFVNRDIFGLPREVFCVERETGSLQWIAGYNVGTHQSPMGFSGAYSGCFVEAIVEDDSVYIWFVDDFTVALQGFALEDGAREVIFSTRKLYQRYRYPELYQERWHKALSGGCDRIYCDRQSD